MPVAITNGDQLLPATMESFWPLSKNKVQLQCFIKAWIKENYSGCKPIFMAGADTFDCVQVQPNVSITVPDLTCEHEEADDRIIFHLHYLVTQRHNISSFVVATDHTDVVVSLLYHYGETWSS